MDDSNVSEEFEKKLKEFGVEIFKYEEIKKFKPKIGEGKFGKVYKGEISGRSVALKKMKFENFDKSLMNECLNEIKNLKFVCSEYVPEFIGCFKGVKKGNIQYGLVFEYINGLTLRRILGAISDDEKVFIVKQVCDIVKFLHSKKMIHRDIKPENIMISKDSENKIVVRIVDFGTCKIAMKTTTFTSKAVGTSNYMPPDSFDFDEESESAKPISNTLKFDIWSTGVMISEIFTGKLPWSQLATDSKKIETFLIQKKAFPIAEFPSQFKQFKEIVEKCVQIEPKDRISADELVDAISKFSN